MNIASYTLICESCGTETSASRKDARNCAACRMLKVLTYAAGRFRRDRTCRSCNAKYRPLRAKDLALCGRCESATQPHADELIKCAICRAAAPPVEGVPVCRACIKDPEGQVRVLKALRKGRVARRAANPGRPFSITRVPDRDTPPPNP